MANAAFQRRLGLSPDRHASFSFADRSHQPQDSLRLTRGRSDHFLIVSVTCQMKRQKSFCTTSRLSEGTTQPGADRFADAKINNLH
jgi:hypothetical protein